MLPFYINKPFEIFLKAIYLSNILNSIAILLKNKITLKRVQDVKRLVQNGVLYYLSFYKFIKNYKNLKTFI